MHVVSTDHNAIAKSSIIKDFVFYECFNILRKTRLLGSLLIS